jgi:hypothetical protein
MKKQQVVLVIIGFFLLTLMATNPSIEDHREGVKKMYKKKLNELNNEKQNDLGSQIGTGIASLIGDRFIDKIVSRENYLLFSVTKATFGSQTKKIGFGVLGNVYVSDYDKINNGNLENDESSIEIDTPFADTSVVSDTDIPLSNTQQSFGNFILSCFPPNGTNLILNSPNRNDIHPAWVNDMTAGSSLGSGWGFNAVKQVQNEQGVFLYGNIYTTRGGLFNSRENGFEGMVWVPYSEWDCSPYPQ